MALKFLSKQSLYRCVLSFSRLKLKACPNIESLNGFELKSHFQSDNSQMMQLPSIKNAGFPKRCLSHAICHAVKFPKPVKTSLPLPKVFTKVCTYFDVTNLSLFYWWVSKISYPWDFARVLLRAPASATTLGRDDETFWVESGYIYFSSL